jgi:hypothetical protein
MCYQEEGRQRLAIYSSSSLLGQYTYFYYCRNMRKHLLHSLLFPAALGKNLKVEKYAVGR